jgi:hypothetical protein
VLTNIPNPKKQSNTLIASLSILNIPGQMAEADRFAWTTGGDKALLHKRRIDVGGSALVHEVRLLTLKNRRLITNSSTTNRPAALAPMNNLTDLSRYLQGSCCI